MLSKGNTKDWRIWWQIFWRHWYIIGISTFVAISIGLLKAYTTAPEFESTSTLMILDTDLLSGSTLRFVPVSPQRDEIEYFRRRITSIEFMKTVLENFDIKSDPKVITNINLMAAQHPEVPRDEIEEIVCIKHLQKRISTRATSINTIEIKARAQTAQEAHDLCTLFTNLAISESQRSQMQMASMASTFSIQLLETYRERLKEAEDRLENFRNGASQGPPSEFQLDPEKLQEIERVIFSIDVDMELKKEQIEELNSRMNEVSKGYRARLYEALAPLKTKMLQRTESVCQLLKKFTWRDVEITVLNEEIAALKKEVINQIRSNISEYHSNLAINLIEDLTRLETLEVESDWLQYQKDTYENILENHQEFVKARPSREAYLARLEREVADNRDIYELILQQVRGNQIRESAQQQEAQLRFRLLMPPERPLERVKPIRRRILMVAFAFGIFIGVAVIFAMENMSTTIKNVDEVTEYLKVPVLATIPRITTSHNRHVHRKKMKIVAILLPMLIISAVLIAYGVFLR